MICSIVQRWKLLSLPRNSKGTLNWKALPPGLYLIEWYEGGKRRRESAGATAVEALEAQRLKRHVLEGKKLGLTRTVHSDPVPKGPLRHLTVKRYLERIEALKKPNTHRKYEAVLERFLDFFHDRETIDSISGDDLTRFIVALRKDHALGANTVRHNAVIVAQFFKRHGRGGITRELQLPERITSLPKEYRGRTMGSRSATSGSALTRTLDYPFPRILTAVRDEIGTNYASRGVESVRQDWMSFQLGMSKPGTSVGDAGGRSPRPHSRSGSLHLTGDE